MNPNEGEGAGREVETPIEIGVLGFWGTRLGETGLGGQPGTV